MDWFRENKVSIFVHYLNIMLMMYIIQYGYNIKNFDYIFVNVIVVLTIIFYWFYKWVLKNKVQKLLLVVLLIIAVVLYLRSENGALLNATFVSNFQSINGLLYDGKATFFSLFKPYLTILLPIILIFSFALYNKKVTETILIFPLAEMLFFWYLSYYEAVEKAMLPFITITVFTYILNNYKKTIANFNKERVQIKADKKLLVVNIVIFTFIISIIGQILPQHSDTKVSNAFIERLEGDTNIDSIIEESGYTLSDSGYNDTEKMLGGPIVLNSEIAFKVKSDKAYYLKGSTKDEYTGYSWLQTKETFIQQSNILSKYTSNDALTNFNTDESNIKSITIYPQNLRTASIMAPMYSFKVSAGNEKIYYADNDSTFISSDKLNNEYTINFFDPDKFIMSNSAENFASPYHDKYFDKYLKLPNTITERTVNLVEDLTRDCSSSGEKVEKLNKYLSKNYTYTLDAPVLPSGKDFVDYFLFEQKKGYCVHFATALTIMCRIAGVPARFVEGYNMDEESKKDGIYNVTDDEAHAWVEYAATNQLWVISDSTPTASEEIQTQQKQQTTTATTNKPQNNENNKLNKTNTPNNNTNTSKSILDNISFKIDKSLIIAFLVSLLFVTLLILFIWFKRNAKKVILTSKSYIPLYEYSLKRLKQYKISKNQTMTDMEFVDTVEIQLQDILKPLVSAAYAEFYGGIITSNIHNKKDIYNKLEQYLKSKENIIKYYLKKII